MRNDEMLSNVVKGEGGRTTSFGDHDWFTSLRIETSSEAFKWAETTMFVSRGRCIIEEGETAVEYEIYKVVN
jgi:hypothetical protein